MQIELGTVAVSALVQAGIGLLFWLAVQRTVEKLDRLEREVSELKEERVARIESDLKEHAGENEKRFERHVEARKGIYERLEKIEREYVPGIECREAMKEMAAGQMEFRAAVVDLAATQEKLNNTAGFVSEVNQRMIALAQDVARIEGRHLTAEV
jgi:TolA-binding protein